MVVDVEACTATKSEGGRGKETEDVATLASSADGGSHRRNGRDDQVRLEPRQLCRCAIAHPPIRATHSAPQNLRYNARKAEGVPRVHPTRENSMEAR